MLTVKVNPYHKPESLLKLNPRGLVPTLQTDNKPLYESTVICEFLEEKYPDHKPHLLPSDPYDRARTRIWTDYCTSRIIPAFHRFLQFQPMSDVSGLDEQRQEFLGHLREFSKEMDAKGPYFLGDEPSLIDFVVAPWAVSLEPSLHPWEEGIVHPHDRVSDHDQVRLWVFDHYKGGLGIPEHGKGGADEATWARWRTWIEAMESRPSIKATMSDRERYLPIYQRYADDNAQSELAKATRKGRGVP